MAFVEDLTVFFADFGVLATPDVGDPITVIFDRAHMEVLGGSIGGTQPVALARSADVQGFVPGISTLTIAGTPYLVADLQPDGTGMTQLVLEVA